MIFKTALAIAALALTSVSAPAGTKLFDDSKLIVEDRFSDEIVGQGPDLVFIPGLSSSREVWRATAERLKGRYRLHLIQIAGFAGEPSRANGKGPVLVPAAEGIDTYLVAQHLAPATLIGHSLGGTMALYLAQKHPEHLKKVLLVDALPFYPVVMMGPGATVEAVTPIAERMRASTEPMPASQKAASLVWMATAPASQAMIGAWSDASDPNVVKNAIADDMELDLRPGLGAIILPVTLIYPDYAPAHQPNEATQQRYQGQYAPLKSIKMVEIENSVHFVMFDQPAKFADALDNFLNE